MKHAETVTFGGSGLDRAAHQRGDAGAMSALLARGQVLALWRGKPLVVNGNRLAWVPGDHPVLALGGSDFLFLGMHQDIACFAADISAWQPVDDAQAAGGSFLDFSEQTHPDLPTDHAFMDLRATMVQLSARDAELAAMAKAVLSWHRSQIGRAHV